MNTNIKEEFNRSLQKFKARQHTLPERIRWKLNYIATLLQAKKCQSTKQLPLEYQLQVSDLQGVNEKGLMVIFNSIVQTLFEENFVVDKQCLIRKKGFFKSWSDGFIKYDQKYIYFNCANKTSRYRLKNVDIRENSSSKRSFDFFYKGSFYMTIKFQKPESMETMFKKIKGSIIREKKKHEDQIMFQNHQEKSQQCIVKKRQNMQTNKKKPQHISSKGRKKYDQLQKQQSKSQHSPKNVKTNKFTTPGVHLIKQVSQPQQPSRELQFQSSILSQKDTSEFMSRFSINKTRKNTLELSPIEKGYQPKKIVKQGQILLNPKQNRLIAEVILNLVGKVKLQQVASCLALYSNWSSSVKQQEVIYSLKSQGKAIVYRVYQKVSWLTRGRETYTLLECRKLDENTLVLLQQSLDNQDKKENFIRAYLSSVFYLESLENQCKVTLQSLCDAKGYSNSNDSNQLLLDIYNDLLHFQNFFNEFIIQKYEQQHFLFTQILSAEEDSEYKSSRVSKSMQELPVEQLQISSEQQQDISLSLYRKSSKKNPFFELCPNSPLSVPTHEYLGFIRNRQHERYYLPLKFQQAQLVKYDDYQPWYCLQKMLETGGHYQITPSLQLKFINQKLIQSQKDILRFIIKQIGANIISGKSVLNISLPVDIFQPRTLLERSAASLGKCPDYLLRISSAQPLEQIKNVTAFLATVPTLELVMQKPFNPILGETFQCYLKGIPLFYEQISHHPPISSYYMKCKEFQLYGNLVAFADVGLNSGVGGNLGVMHIKFQNGYHYECYFPPSQISGLIYGDRKFRSYGKGYVIQRSQKLFAEFSIEKTKKGIYDSKQRLKPGSIIGGIFKINAKFLAFLDQYNQNLKKFPGISKDHIVDKLVKIEGIWFEKIFMNQQDITKGIRAYPVQYAGCCLPSDANFRLDVLYHKQNNLPQSQKQKEILENLQRQDRKLREGRGRKK